MKTKNLTYKNTETEKNMMPEKSRKNFELEKRLQSEIPGVRFHWDMRTGNTIVYLPPKSIEEFPEELGYIDVKTVEFIKKT